MRYRFIDAHRHEHAIATMCRVLTVSKAGYYAWRDRAPSERARQDARLAVAIKAAHRASRRRYGSPRIHAELRAQGVRCGRKRVARIMREHAVRGKSRRRRRVVTTQSDHEHPVAENVLNRQFAVEQIPATNRVWAGDISYLPTREGWLYLAVVLDLRSRRVVGWAMRTSLDRELTLAALQMALQHRGTPAPGLLHHSDRGSQYASDDYQHLVTTFAMTGSMSRQGNCYDNAVVESFFGTLKTELLDGEPIWETRAAARTAVFEYLEGWYNRRRRHSTLGYLSPAEFERRTGTVV